MYSARVRQSWLVEYLHPVFVLFRAKRVLEAAASSAISMLVPSFEMYSKFSALISSILDGDTCVSLSEDDQ